MVDDTRSSDKSPAPEPFAALSSLVLLNHLQQGDIAARDELVRRYWPRLERWASGRLPNRARELHDTFDLVQDTMIAALDRLQDFEPEHEGALLAYLRVAVMNRVRKLVRGVHRRGEKLPLDSDIIVPDQASPLEQVIGRDALERYERALARLRPEDREAIHLKVELDLPYEEITRALGKPTITAARMAVSRALAHLVQEMRRHA
jgi:RNA polymerase sigma-70 factor (ECF subfamily)